LSVIFGFVVCGLSFANFFILFSVKQQKMASAVLVGLVFILLCVAGGLIYYAVSVSSSSSSAPEAAPALIPVKKPDEEAKTAVDAQAAAEEKARQDAKAADEAEAKRVAALSLVDQAKERLAREAKEEAEAKARADDAAAAADLLKESDAKKARLAEEKKQAQARAAEAKFQADEKAARDAALVERLAEEKRQADAKAAEAKRQADAAAAKAAEEKRVRDAAQVYADSMKKFSRYDGFNAAGGDIGSPTRGADETACAAACLQNPSCNYYAYNKPQQICYQKHGDNREAGLVLGLRNGTQFDRTDFPGNQVAYDNELASQSVCRVKCSGNPACQYYVWVNGGGHCWQKSAGRDGNYVTAYRN
jgi:hypothetical protein